MSNPNSNRTATVPDPKDLTLFICPDGGLEFIYDDELAVALRGIGKPVTQRASHVEPTEDGRWSVDVSPITRHLSPFIIGCYDTRAEALSEEQKWVIAWLAGEKFVAESA